jgi:hypothetical protein
VSEDGTSITAVDVIVTDYSGDITMEGALFPLPSYGPFSIMEGKIDADLPEDGKLTGEFTSPIEANGMIDLRSTITVLGKSQFIDFGLWEWIAKAVPVHGVGEAVQITDQTLTLNSADFQGDKLVANLTIENKGATDVSMRITAQGSDGSTQVETTYCGESQLAGTFVLEGTSEVAGQVTSGDKVTGDICWKGATTDSVKIYYTTLSSEIVVWEVKK